MAVETVEAQIDTFLERSRALTGKEVRERDSWNTLASRDAIRHYAFGTSDGNPLWLDPDYAAKTKRGKIVAPPGFLTSVLYPILHGAPMLAPLSSLIGGVEYEWFLPVEEGDGLRASTKQADLYEKKSGSGRRLIFVISEATYSNHRDEVVGKATGTMIRATQVGTELLFDRPIYRYSDVELEKIGEALKTEARSGAHTPMWEDVQIGQEIPTIVRGPLTIGDMVAWQAAIGPSYRAGGLGYVDVLKSPHTGVKNPVTGWPVKYSQQHEDFHLAAQRGMPGPFDNGVMRFAWVCPLVTNWMGDDGVLKRLYVQVRTPAIYGDTIWYQGSITEKRREGERGVVTVRITGTNQVGITTTTGEAQVILPSRSTR